MTTIEAIVPAEGTTAGRRRWPGRDQEPLVALVVVLAVLAAGLLGYRLGGGGDPGDGSAEAGFARDMQTHHAQAVHLSLIFREKSTDPELRAMAYDVITGQQQQAGQMYGWLTLWGLPQTSAQPPMAWMGSGHGGMGGSSSGPLLPDGRMPGMASDVDINRLTTATGGQAEVLYLQLMIAHHRGGISMAQAVLKQTSRPEVRTLALAIANAQQVEVQQMEALLKEHTAP